MKTKITALLLVFIFVFSLTACGGESKGDDNSGNTENGGASGDYELNGPGFPDELTYDYDLSEYISLPEHSSLNVTCTIVETTDEAVDTVIEEELYSAGGGDEITTAAKTGDTVTYDSVGTVISSGSVFEQGTDRVVIIGGSAYLEGFAENFIGLKTGDSATFEYIFPMDYYAEELAGVPVTYKVTIKSVVRSTPAEFTDEYVKSLGIDGVETTEEYREYIRGIFEQRAAEDNAQSIRDAIYDVIYKGAEMLKVPEKEYQYYYNICDKTNQTNAAVNNISVDAYILQSYGSQEAYEAYAKKYSESRVFDDMIMWNLAREYGVEVDPEEYRDEMNYGYENYAESYGAESMEEFEHLFKYDVSEGILLKTALDAVAESATVTPR